MIKSNDELKFVMISFTQTCFKQDLLPFLVSEESFFTYDYMVDTKKQSGVFFSLSNCPKYVELRRKIYKLNLVQFWQFGSKFLPNPYVCSQCAKESGEGLIVHSQDHDVEVFCIHSDYIADEVYSCII